MMGYESHLRVYIEPEGCHPLWNGVKNGIRRSGKQVSLLKSMIIANVLHGPFRSGKNQQSFQEAASHMSQVMTIQGFQDSI